MLMYIKNIADRIKIEKKVMSVVVAAALVLGGLVVSGEAVKAQEAPFVDISTALISLSPQADEVKMNVAARNMPADTPLAVSVADGNICSVEWVELDSRGYTQLCYKRGEVLGETIVTVFVKDNPGIAAQIQVTNRDVADSYVYEGDGSLDIYGLNLTPIPYEVHAVSTDANGYFGLLYSDAAGESKVLVNKVGAYDGSTTIDKGANAITLHVLATGHWQIVLTPVLASAAPTQSGMGNIVSGRFKGDDKMHDVYCANWAGKGNYIVWLYDINNNTRQLLANGAGTYGRTKKDIYLNASHNYYLSIQSGGRWLVEFR